MDFSVIVCTYNRSHNLPRCLGSLAKQENIDGLDWEVLVVDNNSTDDTAKIVQQLSNDLPITVRYSLEKQQGLNYARNRGIQESDGTFFAFVDDDIAVSPKWLISLYNRFQREDADAVGGRIHLDPEVPLPKWITCHPELPGFLGYQDYGDKSQQLDGVSRYPFGGNMAFNRRVVERVGYFNVNLGRKGQGTKKSELFKGAETEYFERMVASYKPDTPKIFYEPNAIVYHKVCTHQLKKKYFLTVHYNAGYQKAYFDDKKYERRFAGIPFFLIPQTLRSAAKFLSQYVKEGPDRAFRQKMTVAHFIGQIHGYHNKYLHSNHHD